VDERTSRNLARKVEHNLGRAAPHLDGLGALLGQVNPLGPQLADRPDGRRPPNRDLDLVMPVGERNKVWKRGGRIRRD
jgi:hypothetical protein